jgi:DNA-binding MarR family transcriptional regulator
MDAALAELQARGLVDGRDGTRALSPEGCAVFTRLVAARRERLAELFADWPQDKHEELAGVLRRLAREIVPDTPGARTLAGLPD